MRKCCHRWGESGRETIIGIERCRRQFDLTLMFSQVVTTTNLSIASGAGTKSVFAGEWSPIRGISAYRFWDIAIENVVVQVLSYLLDGK